jgi:dipeptidyl aminopeptidase/acylaminoacyl peptidase
VLDDGRVAVLHGQGDQRLGLYDPETAELTDFDLPYTDWKLQLSADGTTIVGIAGAPDIPWSVVAVSADSGEVKVLRGELESPPDPAYLPLPRAQELEGPFGRPVHAFVYPPSNPTAQAPEGELPPYVVFVHGGPTGHSTSVLDLEIAYFTSRGLGVIDVNYGGSRRSYRAAPPTRAASPSGVAARAAGRRCARSRRARCSRPAPRTTGSAIRRTGSRRRTTSSRRTCTG